MRVTDVQVDRACNVWLTSLGASDACMRAVLNDFVDKNWPKGQSTVEVVGEVRNAELQPQRDYRKEFWMAAYLAHPKTSLVHPLHAANSALRDFDESFPS